MEYIILNTESTCDIIPFFDQEIIHIVSARFSSDFKPIDVFNEFVKPVVTPELTYFCKKLTKIKQKQIDNAQSFPIVLQKYLDWINIKNDYKICIWSSLSKNVIIKECIRHNITNYDFLNKCVNLKLLFHKMNRISIKRCVLMDALIVDNIIKNKNNDYKAINDLKDIITIFLKHTKEWSLT